MLNTHMGAGDTVRARTDYQIRVTLPGCRVCGWQTAMTLDGLCPGCVEIREWSRVNRAFCQLLHRVRYVEDLAAPELVIPSSRV